jgi:DNA-binding IclR family transcriptional regulator
MQAGMMAGTQALDRGLSILAAVAAASLPLATAEIAEAVDVPESTVYRLVQALERRALLSRIGRGRVGMGPAVFALARSAQHQVGGDIPAVALPFMYELVEHTGETAILTVPYGLGVICVETVESPRPVRVSWAKWSSAPLYGGSAVAVLAHLDHGTIARAVASAKGKHYADGRPVTKEHLDELIAGVRERGYMIASGEVDPDATGIGVPIFDGNGRGVAALSVAAPTERVSEDVLPSLIREVQAAGRGISDRLAQHLRLELIGAESIEGPAGAK